MLEHSLSQNLRERGWGKGGCIGGCFANGEIPVIPGKGETFGADGELHHASNLKTQKLAV